MDKDAISEHLRLIRWITAARCMMDVVEMFEEIVTCVTSRSLAA